MPHQPMLRYPILKNIQVRKFSGGSRLRPGLYQVRLGYCTSESAGNTWEMLLQPIILPYFKGVIDQMKKSTKAALLSAFVLPGMGHIFLKKYICGIVLSGVSLAGIYYLVSKTVERALQILEKVQTGDTPLDIATITALASQQPTGPEADLLNVATVAFIICWLIGIVDAYRIGRAHEQNDDVLANH